MEMSQALCDKFEAWKARNPTRKVTRTSDPMLIDADAIGMLMFIWYE